MPPLQVEGIDQLRELIGTEIGPTDWLEVTQEDIDKFAEVSRDFQWIHTDPKRAARESPFGTTVAHGNLTLSLIDGLRGQLIAQSGARGLFSGTRAPDAALAGLYLYFSCWQDAHETAQSVNTADGSYWHAIVHRQEPDAGNSSYWFRRVGQHAIFPELLREATKIGGPGFGQAWDPFAFIDFCEQARSRPGSDIEQKALEIQRAEWQLLFDYCASPRA